MDTRFKKGHTETLETKEKRSKSLKEGWKKRKEYHGMYGTKFHNSWRSMVTRCRGTAGQESKKKYKDKGITVCEKWLKFSCFYEDMFDSYIEGLTIDRINNELGYFKENCRWATTTQQAYNKSQTIKINYNGQIFTMDKAAEFIGIRMSQIRNRYHRRYKKGLISVEELFDKKNYSE